jgi:hypothetical protein
MAELFGRERPNDYSLGLLPKRPQVSNTPLTCGNA